MLLVTKINCMFVGKRILYFDLRPFAPFTLLSVKNLISKIFSIPFISRHWIPIHNQVIWLRAFDSNSLLEIGIIAI